MVVNRNLIRRLIREDFEIRNRRNRRSLSSFLFEDMSDEEAADVLDKNLDVKKGPEAIVNFLNSPEGSDPKVRALIKQGTKDGDDKDETVTVDEGAAPTLSSLTPTQIEIDIDKSLMWPLSETDTLDKFMSGGTVAVGGGKVTISGNIIVDGHHRWSSLWAIRGGDAKIAAVDIKFPGISGPAAILAASQVAIAGALPAGKETEAIPKAKANPDGNILGVGPEAIRSKIVERIGKPATDAQGKPILGDEWVKHAVMNYADHFEISEDLRKKLADSTGAETDGIIAENMDELRTAIIDKVVKNLASLPSPASGSPARVYMPQLDGKGPEDPKTGKPEWKINVNDVYGNMRSGDANYKPDFVAEGRGDDSAIMERWQRLAGLIK
jgi:hypothetical protein